jgi:hypothetical protein
MSRNWLLALGGLAALAWYLNESGTSSTPGVGDPGDTQPDGSADGGTDATVLDEVLNVFGIPDYIEAWADAITQHEGWANGTRSFRNNNPGNMRVQGDLGVDSGGFGIFSSYQLGRNALTDDLKAKVRKYGNWTLYQVMARYAPPSDGNNTSAYAAAIANVLNCTTGTLVSSIAGIWSTQGLAWNPIQFVGAPTALSSSQLADAGIAQDGTTTVADSSQDDALSAQFQDTLDGVDG